MGLVPCAMSGYPIHAAMEFRQIEARDRNCHLGVGFAGFFPCALEDRRMGRNRSLSLEIMGLMYEKPNHGGTGGTRASQTGIVSQSPGGSDQARRYRVFLGSMLSS
jgi:hypothetical protein